MEFRKAITIMLLMVAMAANGQTTYIPKYESYLHVVTGKDTFAVENTLDTLVLADPGGKFTLRIDHEDVTKEKVKRIKRAKKAAGWSTFAAVLSGVSRAFSDNSFQYMVRSDIMKRSSSLANINKEKAVDEETLEIVLWIDNNSDDEMMVCDMERGSIWWILPRQTLNLELNNPESTNLRISDANSNFVRYAGILTGSRVKKWDIDMETDEYWFSPIYAPDKPHETSNILYFVRINKLDSSEKKLKKEEYWTLKKELKKAKK